MSRRTSSGTRTTTALLIVAALVLTAALIFAALSPILLSADALAAERAGSADHDFDWSWTIPAGKTIEIRGINGGIHVELAPGRETRVTAVKRARRGDPDAVKIEFVEHAGGVTVCAVYPGRGRKKYTCGPDGEGELGSWRNDTEVRFTVQVPAGVAFAGRTVNGSIRAEDLKSAVEAETVNGSVHISTSGVAEASTVNGSITAAMGAGGSEDIGFRTVNGSITLEMPAGFDADLDVSTVNGSITTDFPVSVRGKFGRRSIRGTLGDGGRDLSLQTVNGNILLREEGKRDS